MHRLNAYLQNHRLLFDGGFGTYYSAKYHTDIKYSEKQNLMHPDQVKEVHLEYIKAGARAIRTNTFDCYQAPEEERGELLRQGLLIAKDAVYEAQTSGITDEDIFVFASLGPATGETTEHKRAQYQFAIDTLLKNGADCFLFETQSQEDGLAESIHYIREHKPDAFVMVSFAVMPDGYTAEGGKLMNLLASFAQPGMADVLGINCVSSPNHMKLLLEQMNLARPILFSVMPNAGYPVVRGIRTVFDSKASYFASQMSLIARKGIRILGGCCGTTPEYIEKMQQELLQIPVKPLESSNYQELFTSQERSDTSAGIASNRFLTKIRQGKKVIAVELDSPKNADLTAFMESAKRLNKVGIDAMTIADCPIAVARMDSTLLACKVKQELDLDVIPHMTCRDRNTNATKALLLGAQAQGIRNVLLITGDPIPSAQRDEVKQVYQFHSRKLMSYVDALNQEFFTEEPLAIFGALNVNARNFEVECNRALEKAENGCVGFLTQPVMTDEAIANLRIARERLPEDVILLGGIIPVISERNARFMNEEINGISIPQEMIEAYVGADRAKGEALAVHYVLQIAGRIRDCVDGYYLMTPFNRIALMERIVEQL